MDTIEVLIKARVEVEKGWGKGFAVDVEGNVCALGAVDVALGASRENGTCSASLIWDRLDVLAALDTHTRQGVVRFNDHPDTTKADVLAMFDRAINSQVPVGDSAHVHRTVA